MSQREFRKHIADCKVCWRDAQERIDLDFDPGTIPEPYPEDAEQ
jgi:hypothetical protein